MALPQKKRYTYADVLTWDEGERIELICGDPVMHPSPNKFHQRISVALSSRLYDYLEDKPCEVYTAPFDVRLFEQEGDRPEDVDTVVQPDLFIVCDPSMVDDLSCKGAPAFIIEILSPSNRRHDLLVKYNLYQKAGVKEYWIVDPETKTVQVYLLEDGEYHGAEVYNVESSVKVNVLENCYIDLSRVFR